MRNEDRHSDIDPRAWIVAGALAAGPWVALGMIGSTTLWLIFGCG